MKPEIKARFTPAMLEDIAGRYGISASQLRESGGFESFIYSFEREGAGYILRVGHSNRRGADYVHGEVEWINYLVSGGACAAGAVHSQRGNLVEPMDDGAGEQFIAAAFHRAAGRPPWEFGWSPELYVTYGKALGRMHALTTHYTPTDPIGFRPPWDHPTIMDAEPVLAVVDPVAGAIFKECVARCRQLPKTADAYGLVHFDAHGANFLVDSVGKITLFDFDDCNYNWFAYDLAIVLFYMVMWKKDPAAFAREFLERFFAGYRQEYRLHPSWLETFPLFLKMREIDLYGLILRDFDLDTEDDAWITGYMKNRRERIHARVPYLDMDFSMLASRV